MHKKEKIKAINESQIFIADKYEKLKSERDLQMINKKQEKEINDLKAKSSNLKVRGTKEEKIDALEQNGRRQHLEIVGIPIKQWCRSWGR